MEPGPPGVGDLVEAHDLDVGGKGCVADPRPHQRKPFPGAGAHSQGHFVGIGEVGLGEQLIDEGMGGEARIDRHEVVAPAGPQSRLSPGDPDPQMRAVAERGQRRPGLDHRIDASAQSLERFHDDPTFELDLEVVVGVLQVAAAASVGHEGARFGPATRRHGFVHAEGHGPGEAFLVLGDLDLDPLTRERTGDEHDATVVEASDADGADGD